MISVSEAFDKFKGRLEPGEREQEDAICRRERVKEVLDDIQRVSTALLAYMNDPVTVAAQCATRK